MTYSHSLRDEHEKIEAIIKPFKLDDVREALASGHYGYDSIWS